MTPLLPVGAGALLYLLGVSRLHARGDRWPADRTVCLLTGAAALAAALLPPLADPEGFVPHVVQHLLLAMAGPVLLALAAPMTLALRTLPSAARRPLLRALHSGAARVLLHPAVVLLLAVGGTAATYRTGLTAAAEALPWLHLLVHAHMLAAGCLLAWYLVGRDPVTPRPSTRARLVVLLLATAAHDVLAKAVWADGVPGTAWPVAEVRSGAELLFTAGDLVDLLLAAAVLAAWYARGGRALARKRRRVAAAGTMTSPTIREDPS